MTKNENSKLNNSLEELRQAMIQRQSTQMIQLPLWPETKRGTPNSFIRSALFAAIQSKDRVFLKEVTLASQKGITVKYTGEQLNQEDLSVWETLAHIAKEHPLGHICDFSAHSLLKQLGLHTGGTQHTVLHSTIVRLTACAVEIQHEGKTFGGSLVEAWLKDDVSKHYKIRLNRELIKLFGENQWTALDWQQREKLRGKALAQALHAFYSSHRNPFPIKLETLKEYVGSATKQKARFKANLRNALDELVMINFLKSYCIEGDIVTVERILPTELPKDNTRGIRGA